MKLDATQKFKRKNVSSVLIDVAFETVSSNFVLFLMCVIAVGPVLATDPEQRKKLAKVSKEAREKRKNSAPKSPSKSAKSPAKTAPESPAKTGQNRTFTMLMP
jgi:hypothetical protein